MTYRILLVVGALAAGALATPPPEREPSAVKPRDLFLPRISSTAVDTGQVTTLPVKGQLTVTGLMIDPAGSTALLEDKSKGESRVVAVGDELGPWKIERIDLTQLVLKSKDGAALTVELGQAFEASFPAEAATDEGGPGTTLDSSAKDIEEQMRRRREAERGKLN